MLTSLAWLLTISMISDVSPLENGLARTPPMGWMSWGYYMCGDQCDTNPDKCLDEKLILSVVDSFYTEGYQEAGFEYIIIDDCWSERQRDGHRRLVPDHKRFPRGMKYIADYIHARGLKFGMYTNIAKDTCMRYPGSKDHFAIDSKTFAEWGADYIKVDGCFVSEEYLDKAYIKLGHYLNITGRPMVYSCSWPYYKVYIHNNKQTQLLKRSDAVAKRSEIRVSTALVQEGLPNYKALTPLCNLWRNYHDVELKWASIRNIIQYYENNYHLLHKYHGPGHWNDPDMVLQPNYRQADVWTDIGVSILSHIYDTEPHISLLIFGTETLSPSQARIQLAVYIMLSAPLLISCPMHKITPYEKSLLNNLDLMAIGQDVLGIMARPYKLAVGFTLWVKPHLPFKGDIYQSVSFAFVNFETRQQHDVITPEEFGLNCTDGYSVMDVFSRQLFRNITLNETMEVVVPAEDVLLYTLFPL